MVVEATIQAPSHGGYALSFKGSKIAMDQEGVVQAIANRITPWWNRPCPLLPTYSPPPDDSVRHPHRVDRHRRHGRAHVPTSATGRLSRNAVHAQSHQSRADPDQGRHLGRLPSRRGPADGCALHDGRLPQDVREVYFGNDGVLAGLRPGMIVIDMTTTEPSLACDIAEAAQAREADALDAPVSGGDVGARNATLSIMIGARPTPCMNCHAAVRASGKKMVHQGGPGAGQHTKLCNQIVIAGTMVGVCESLLYGYRAELDVPRMLESIRGGAAACWTLDNLAPRIVDRNFDPGFSWTTS